MTRRSICRLGALILLAAAAARFAMSGFIPATLGLIGDFAAAFPTPYFARWRPDFPTNQVLGADHQLWNYGPMFHVVTMPLLLVPRWSQVPLVWAIVNLAALSVSFALVGRLCSASAKRSTTLLLTVAALWLLYQPTVNCFSQGNIEIIEMMFVLLGCTWIRDRHEAMGGGTFAVASLIKVLPAGFIGWLILRRRWRAVIAAAAMIAAVAALTAVTLRWDLSLTQRSSMPIAGDNPQAGFHELSITSLFMHRASRLDDSTPEPRWFPAARATAAARAGQLASAALALCFVGLLIRATPGDRTQVPPEEIGVLLLLMLLLPPWNHDYYFIFALPAVTWLIAEGAGDGDTTSIALAVLGYVAISPPLPYSLVTRLGLVQGSFAYALNYHDVPLFGGLILLFASARRLLMRHGRLAPS